ncbi:MAG: hypothetical protein NW217_16965 [Hyphomicrobiaceae bacterium]|nr:hypothetical protein [Hyphomicrobiaceae bacterium]
MPQNAVVQRAHIWLAIATAAGTGLLPLSATAAIRCHESYQIVQGNYISTPYCEDNYLAEVARTYGTRVAARDIRNDPNRKEQVCRLVGGDIRVMDICAQYRSDGGRKR